MNSFGSWLFFTLITKAINWKLKVNEYQHKPECVSWSIHLYLLIKVTFIYSWKPFLKKNASLSPHHTCISATNNFSNLEQLLITLLQVYYLNDWIQNTRWVSPIFWRRVIIEFKIVFIFGVILFRENTVRPILKDDCKLHAKSKLESFYFQEK